MKYQYLPKHLKTVVRDFDADMVDYLLSEGMYSELAYVLNIIANMYEDENQPMSQFHEAGINYVMNKWGDDTLKVIGEMRILMEEDIKAGKYDKPKPLTPEERIAKRHASIKQFDTVRC